jgi:hypothetical protein
LLTEKNFVVGVVDFLRAKQLNQRIKKTNKPDGMPIYVGITEIFRLAEIRIKLPNNCGDKTTFLVRKEHEGIYQK